MNGKDDYFPGLLPLCYTYLEHINCDPASFRRIRQYLDFIRGRSTGELMTPAIWMRRFVQGHPEYKQDSVVSPSIAYDLLKACNEIGLGRLACKELHGDVAIEPIILEGIYATPLDSLRIDSEKRFAVLQQYRTRAAVVDGPLSTPSSTKRRMRSRSDSFGGA